MRLELDEANGVNFADTSGLENDAVAPSGGVVAGAGGHAGRAVGFAGGVVEIPNGNSIPESPQTWIEAWVQPALPLDRARTIVRRDAWSLRQVGDTITYTVAPALGSCIISHPVRVEAGQWAHVAGWYNGLQVVVAVNGEQYGASCPNGPMPDGNGGAMTLGGILTNEVVTEDYAGRIDEVRLRQTAPTSAAQTSAAFSGSELISAPDQRRLNRWIGDDQRTWRLCYAKRLHTATSTEFHSRCDHRGPSISVIRLANGATFGGYTGISWNPRNTYIGYDRAFLFNLDSDERFPIGYYYENSVYSHANHGPTFGSGHDIYVDATMNLRYCNFPYAYSCDGRSAGQPTEACTQRLCNVPRSTIATIADLEVWIHEDY